MVVPRSRYRVTPQKDAKLCKKPPISYVSQQRISSVIKKMITHDWTVGRDYGERLKMLNLVGREGPHKLLPRQPCKEEASSDSGLETASWLPLLLLSFGSVAQLCPTLWPRGLQHARPPCPSLTPRVYWNSGPLSQWCHPAISSYVVPFSRLQSFPASGSFPMSQLFESGGQSIGVSTSALVLPMNIQDWFPLGWTGGSCSPRDSQESSTFLYSFLLLL